jgi:hypothetical protein
MAVALTAGNPVGATSGAIRSVRRPIPARQWGWLLPG